MRFQILAPRASHWLFWMDTRATPVTRRDCAGCLERKIKTASGEQTQYYHRQVTLMLVTGAPAGRKPLRITLDHEPILPGEDEVATAKRLLERVIDRYPRAFDLVMGDALYWRES